MLRSALIIACFMGLASPAFAKCTGNKVPRPLIGMLHQEVIDTCLGKPRQTNTTQTAGHRHDQLVFWDNSYAYLTDGVVTAVQRTTY